ncbi:hypothetical protein RN001_015602 [Aquatica leii]|uniref:SSD domain-containing protein n=1 Tax=Aquatica leii TaxID=1421715 RepID=A0AAN7NZ75_9COLE|nr:hypothetical protein RN001_015602 [Aquatica leii]
MNFNWFAHILVHHSLVVLIGVAVFSVSCLVIPFTLKALPDFSDPQMGFETRGTVLASRITAWKNLEKSTKLSGPFAVNPKEFLERKNNVEFIKIKKKNPKKNKTKVVQPNIFISEDKHNRTRTEKNNWVTLHNLINQKSFERHNNIHVLKEGYFCGSPDRGYAHIVWESDRNADLFTLDSLLALCRLEYELVQAKYYKDLCTQTFRKPKRCCKPWSLVNYIAQLHNRTSCLAIVEEDIKNMKELLKSCSQYYHNLQLAPDCHEKGRCKVPSECIRHNAVFNILNYLTSTTFLPPHKSSDVILKETMTFLPIARSTASLPYYHVLEKANLEYGGISAVAMEFGIKNALFDECLIRDAWLMSSGGIFVFLCIWMYTKSLFITLMTIIAITFSLGISYFMYTLVFELRFFPFMNLLSTIVAIGIGADDAFIFCKAWHSARAEMNSSTIKIMNSTFNHAFVSMLITSVTTAAAFLASYISSITAVRCFSIFATTAVIINCILMMTWLPACIVIEENFYTKCSSIKNWCSPFILSYRKFWERFLKFKTFLPLKLWNDREEIVVGGVMRFRYCWFVVLTLISIGSAVVVLYYPKLQLPNSPEFQLLDSSHPFEQYDLIYKNRFWFQRSERGDDGTNANYKLPLRFVWGILPVDNGNYLDPQSLGTLELDPDFDVSRKDSQLWLLNFCRQIRKQSFYQSTLGALLPNCFIESFMAWMQRRCLDPIDNMDRTPCCEKEHFPYNSSVFNTCIVSAMGDLYETPSEYFIPGMAGPKFSKDQFPTIKAIVVEYDSNYSYSMSFDHMHAFFTQVETWTNEQLKDAPLAMKRGWFVSELEFYDLQQVLSQGTVAAIGVSMGLALTVLLLSTLNIFTSLYAVITITCSILVIMAILVLLGWKLNVLESIAVSTAIGLTVDFSLHYTVHYKLCPNTESRERCTKYALTNMIGPASMAAITTGAAGAFMMPSIILPYIQIGIFLLTVMSISWIYATFYLGSLLFIAGPENHFGQFQYSKLLCCINSSQASSSSERRNRPTSSSLSETHELDSLTSKSGPTARSGNKTLQRSLSSDKTSATRHFTDQSPSATSAITIIMTDDN